MGQHTMVSSFVNSVETSLTFEGYWMSDLTSKCQPYEGLEHS
jgi:hypothetical protein